MRKALLPAIEKLPDSRSARPVAAFPAASATFAADPAWMVPRFSVSMLPDWVRVPPPDSSVSATVA